MDSLSSTELGASWSLHTGFISVNVIAHNRKASNALCTLVKREKISDPGENCQRNVTDLAGSLVTSSRPPGRLQKRPDDRT